MAHSRLNESDYVHVIKHLLSNLKLFAVTTAAAVLEAASILTPEVAALSCYIAASYHCG